METEYKLDIELHNDELDIITAQFFELFTNLNGKIPEIDKLKEIFLEDGIIINNSTGTPVLYNLDGFITPRKALLTNGQLVNFCESEISSTTNIYRNIAHRICQYKKSGIMDGIYFETNGVKMIQFIRINAQWKMSSLSWCDEV